MSDPLDTFIDALAKKGIPQGRRVGREFVTLCPAHEDHDPSLNYHAEADGTLLMICRSAGCRADEIVASLGLTWADLLPSVEASSSGFGEVVAQYVYEDHDGTPLYRVQRFKLPDGRKRFIQQRHTPRGYEPGLGNVKRVPYRLPRLLQGIRDRHTVFIVEGEKDVHTLEFHGFVATTNSQGAKSWKRDFATYFEGAKRVVVLPDNDDEGISWGLGVVASLKGKVRDLRLVMLSESAPLADKEDVTDWFERHGGTKEKLIQIVQGHDRPGGRLLRNGLEIEAAHVEYLWRPRIPMGHVTLLAGHPESGKSFVTVAIGATVTVGGTFPDRDDPVMAGNVVYVPFEDDPAIVRDRFEAMGGNSALLYVLDPRDGGQRRAFDAQADVPRLLDEMADLQGGVSLLVIDPILHLFAGLGANPMREHETRRALDPLVVWARETGAAVILVTHLNKTKDADSELQRVMGSGAFAGLPRSVLRAGYHGEGSDRVLAHLKNNYGQKAEAMRYRILPISADVGEVSWDGEASVDASEIRGNCKGSGVMEIDRWLVDFLGAAPDLRRPVGEIYEAAALRGWSKRQVQGARDRVPQVWHGKGSGFPAVHEMWLVTDEMSEHRARKDLA